MLHVGFGVNGKLILESVKSKEPRAKSQEVISGKCSNFVNELLGE